MVHRQRLWLIDFQGARLGPRQYDPGGTAPGPLCESPPEGARKPVDGLS